MTGANTDRRTADRRQDLAAMGATADQFRHRAKLAEQQRDDLIEAMRVAHDMSLDDEHFAARQHLLNAIAKATGAAS